MGKFLLIVTMIVGLSGHVRAQTNEAIPDPAIEAVIQSQIDAFRADDFAKAFTFASPTIQGIFGSVDRFAAMVRQGFPMVQNPDEVRFLELRSIRGEVWQKVLVRDASGAYHALDYQMIPSGDGWQIDGVQLLRAPQVGA